jgi:hypothetical protein
MILLRLFLRILGVFNIELLDNVFQPLRLLSELFYLLFLLSFPILNRLYELLTFHFHALHFFSKLLIDLLNYL